MEVTDIRAHCLHTIVFWFLLVLVGPSKTQPSPSRSQTALHCVSVVWNFTATLQTEVNILYQTSQVQIKCTK